jgi:3-polyprenyl-4-hydroxybenzoate decarboxylase
MLRETPLHAGHLENLLRLASLGTIASPVSAFYIRPKSVDDLVAARSAASPTCSTSRPTSPRWREVKN